MWGNLDLPTATEQPVFNSSPSQAYTYKPEPGESKRSKPKPVSRNGAHSLISKFIDLDLRLIILFVAPLIACPFAFVSGCKEQRRQELLAKDAGTTAGTITNAYERRQGRGGSRGYSVDVFYSVDGKSYEDNFSVDSSFFYQHVDFGKNIKNGIVKMKYAKADPSLAIIEGTTMTSSAGIGVGLLLLAFGIGGICYLLFLAD